MVEQHAPEEIRRLRRVGDVEPTQPLLPSVSPIRLCPLETKVPKASGPRVPLVFPAAMVLPNATVEGVDVLPAAL